MAPHTAPSEVVDGTSTAAGPITTAFPVKGMTCRSCEVRVARFVGRLPNVEHVAASAVQGRVVVESSAPVSPAAIEEAISKAGYEIGRTPWLERNPKVWITAGAGVLLVAALAMIAQVTGFKDLAAGVGDLGSGGLLVALLLGLAAGVSTCAAIAGGLVLALSASFEARRVAAGDTNAGFGTQMRPALLFTAGRVAGFAILGAALGAAGASFTMPPQVTAMLMIAVAIVMTFLGTRLTGISPRVATWSPTLPMGMGRRLGLDHSADGGYTDARAAGLGAASFFLPCGFTQAVQIYALSTGSPLFAGALLAVFAIGTAPGLLALAGLPVVVPGAARPTLLRLVGVVVLGFAVLNAGAGLRLASITMWPAGVSVVETATLPEPTPLAGIAGGILPTPRSTSVSTPGAALQPVPSSRPSASETPQATLPAVQDLRTYQDVNGYGPENVSIRAGVPTRWIVESRSSQTCAAFLIVPDLGIQVYLVKGDENAIDLPALKPGRLEYTCSMGMFWGSITIVEDPAA